MYKIPHELKQAVLDDKCISFVGAGLSYQLINALNQPIGGWVTMVEEILKYLDSYDKNTSIYMPLLKRTGIEPIKVLELLESDPSIEKHMIYDFLKEYFHVREDNNLSIQKKVAMLSNKIITTNYDSAFEMVDRELQRKKAYKGKNYELTKNKDTQGKLLFKLHGCYEECDSMVLFPQDYCDLYKNNEPDAEHSLLVLRNIIYNNSLLFMGTGMGDFQINSIFKELKNIQKGYAPKHFIITKNDLDSELDFLIPIKVKSFDDIEVILDQLIDLKNSRDVNEDEFAGSDESKKELNLLKNQLRNTTDEMERKDILLKREAYEHFEKAFDYSDAGEYEDAIREYERSIELKSDFHQAHYNLGLAFTKLARETQDEQLFERACHHYEISTVIKPDKHEAYNNWGSVLESLSKLRDDDEAIQLLEQSFLKYEAVITIKPDKHEAYYNWGNALKNLAKLKEDQEAIDLLEESFEKYKLAISIKPDKDGVYNNWGIGLDALASLKDKEQNLNKALEMYQRAINIKPDKNITFYNWGNALKRLAKMKSDEEAVELYEAAFSKYKSAVYFEPNAYKVYNNWALGYESLADIKPEERNVLLLKAKAMYEKAIEINVNYSRARSNLKKLEENLEIRS